MDNYHTELEKKLNEMIKQKQQIDKLLLRLEWVIGLLSCLVLLIPAFVCNFLPINDWQKFVFVFSGLVVSITGFCFALKIEQIAGYYECKHCKHKYVPTYKAVNLAPHMGRARYMRCPKCGKKSWQKKVISNE